MYPIYIFTRFVLDLIDSIFPDWPDGRNIDRSLSCPCAVHTSLVPSLDVRIGSVHHNMHQYLHLFSVYVCGSLHTYIHTHIMCMFVYLSFSPYICVYTYIHMYLNIHIYVQYTYLCKHKQIDTYFLHLSLCVYICIHIYMYNYAAGKYVRSCVLHSFLFGFVTKPALQKRA